MNCVYKSLLLVACAFAALSLPGCGLFKKSQAPAVEQERRVHVTLIGASILNTGRTGESRPVQVCAYLVQMPNWLPEATGKPECVSGRDVLASVRRVLAPDQALQFSIDVSRASDIWLIIDADYAKTPAGYMPLRVPVKNSGWSHIAVRLDDEGVHDAQGGEDLRSVQQQQSSSNAAAKSKGRRAKPTPDFEAQSGRVVDGLQEEATGRATDKLRSKISGGR